ncbi:hypothetical protein Pelo_14827 [Pelomyxa schiedti]|nr:hypothetical protein Pelo_14827 [Pelomyxa schiedti]
MATSRKVPPTFWWLQGGSTVTVRFRPPQNKNKGDIDVVITATTLRAGFKGAAPICEGTLYAAVKPGKCKWEYKMRARHDYDAEDPFELSFKDGDIFNVLEDNPSGWFKGELDGAIGVDELGFHKGDIIAVLRTDDSGWWEGELDGDVGWFPAKFVRVITEKEKIPVAEEATPSGVGGSTAELNAATGSGVNGILEPNSNVVPEKKEPTAVASPLVEVKEHPLSLPATPPQLTGITKVLSLLRNEFASFIPAKTGIVQGKEIEIIVETVKTYLRKLQDENTLLRTRLSDRSGKKSWHNTSTMTSLIPAGISQFTVKELLGTGSYGAAFKVQFQGSKASLEPQMMVMKLQFNMDEIVTQTLLRNKYMTEVQTLALIPHHQNVIHPLGAFVIPSLPQDFLELLHDKPAYEEWAKDHRSFVFFMPCGGIPLSGYKQSLLSSLPPRQMVGATLNLFHQALSAINHLESNAIVHRDIKEDNIVVDPPTQKLTLIDFGMAQECIKDTQGQMAAQLTPTGNTWGNLGTIPPEIMSFINNPRAGSQLFPLSKCDSFSLALTFYNALLPANHKFIGSRLNGDMCRFTTKALVDSFPLPPPFVPTKPPDPRVEAFVSVLIDMMNPQKNLRMSAACAITLLTPLLC